MKNLTHIITLALMAMVLVAPAAKAQSECSYIYEPPGGPWGAYTLDASYLWVDLVNASGEVFRIDAPAVGQTIEHPNGPTVTFRKCYGPAVTPEPTPEPTVEPTPEPTPDGTTVVFPPTPEAPVVVIPVPPVGPGTPEPTVEPTTEPGTVISATPTTEAPTSSHGETELAYTGSGHTTVLAIIAIFTALAGALLLRTAHKMEASYDRS